MIFAQNTTRSTQDHNLTILVVLAYPMLHTKFQGHRFIFSGRDEAIGLFVLEKKIFKCFIIYGYGAYDGHETQPFEKKSFLTTLEDIYEV